MHNLLFRMFIPQYREVSSPRVRERYGKLAGIVGIVTNLLLTAVKMAVGAVTGSIAIIADGANSLGDAASSVITLVGFKLAEKPEDKKHPYGHARYEYLAGMLVSLLILVVGFELGMRSLDKILHPNQPVPTPVAVIVLLLSILAKLWQASFYMAAGRAIQSVTLLTTGTDSRNDVISTTAVLLSLLAGHWLQIPLDGYFGLLVALFILWSGFQQARETMSPLLGEAPTEELVAAISQRVFQTEGVLGMHDLVVHNYGPGRAFASLHVEVDAAVDVMHSHDCIDNLEHTISQELHIHCVIHLDPVDLTDPNREPLRACLQEVIAPLEGVMNIHDLRLVPGPTHTNVLFDVVISHDCPLPEEEILKAVSEAVCRYRPTFRTVAQVERSFTV